jgi:hypothetical protein
MVIKAIYKDGTGKAWGNVREYKEQNGLLKITLDTGYTISFSLDTIKKYKVYGEVKK